MIHLAIFDDNNSLRSTLQLVLETWGDIRVVGAYPDALGAVEAVRRDRPDVVLMDVDMPGRTGIEAVRLLRQAGLSPKTLMLTVYEDPDRIFEAVSAGAVGYLLKKTPADGIAEAIRQVAAGGAVMTPSVALKVLAAFQQSPKPGGFLLTDKEREVLQRLVEGDSYKLIAMHCGISMGTVRTHICNIYEKLQVNSKSEAVAKALKTGLFR